MDYTHLTSQQATQLRHERLHRLEAEHFRVKLALEEADEASSAQAQAELTDLERRIGWHREALGIVLPPDGVEEPGPQSPDTPGSGDEAHAAAKRADAGPMTAAADYQDGPHEDSAPEGLETKSVDPEFATTTTTTTHHTDGAEHDEPAGGADEVAAGAEDGGESDSPRSV